jgi:hypothetical protein
MVQISPLALGERIWRKKDVCKIGCTLVTQFLQKSTHNPQRVRIQPLALLERKCRTKLLVSSCWINLRTLIPGTGLSIYLTDRMGRKKLLLLSGFGMAAAMALLV